MFRWIRNNWKLLTAILFAIIAAAVLAALYVTVPPVAAFITALPVFGPYVLTLATPAAAAVVGAAAAAATLVACAVINTFNSIINALDNWIRPGKAKKIAEYSMLHEDSDDEELKDKKQFTGLGGRTEPRSEPRHIHGHEYQSYGNPLDSKGKQNELPLTLESVKFNPQ